MIGRSASLVLVALGATGPALAQVRPIASASTRLLDPTRGSTAPAIWLGLGLEADRERWGGRIGLAGAAGTESWGGEASLTLRGERPLSRHLFLIGRAAGLAERPIGGLTTREANGRLGLRVGDGRLRVEVGALGVTSTLLGSGGVGGFAGARVSVGRLLLQGELGQFTTVTGASVVNPNFGQNLADVPDTAIKKNAARRLGHGVLGGTWTHDWLQVTGRVIRRSRLAADDRMGWQLGVGVAPFAGVRFDVLAAMAPVGPSIYLPFRRQLTFGISLAERRPRRDDRAGADPSPILPSGFEVLPRDEGAVMARLRLRYPGATRVELLADFTDWTPVSVPRVAPGVFELELPVAPGVHLINLRVDGGPPIVPPGLEGTDDGFGGRAGVLVVR